MEENKPYKIKMDISQGIFEAEGDEGFVQKNLEQFKEILATGRTLMVSNSMSEKPQSEVLKKKVIRSSSNPTLVKDLNLKPSGLRSLQDFYNEKLPQSNIENNLVFVYYLQKILSISGITMDHIFSCYKDVGLKVPLSLRQSIADTASRYGYLDTSNMQDIRVIIRGENFIEHDLPKKVNKTN